MFFLEGALKALLILSLTSSTLAASSWGFADATVSVQSKGSGVSGGYKEKFAEHKALSKPVTLEAADTLKLILTTQEGRTAKHPHQVFLLLQDPESGLDISFPFSVKETGKAKVELTQKELPTQFLKSSKSIEASIVIGSFGSAKAYKDKAFSLSIDLDPNVPLPISEKPLRYGKLPEIHHIFRADPKSPNIMTSLIFTVAVLATIPVLLGGWLYLGGNLNHLSKALQDAPLSHVLFFGSIVSIEGVFFMYYTSWRLFTALPVLLTIGTVTFLSGSRALTEVQERRPCGVKIDFIDKKSQSDVH